MSIHLGEALNTGIQGHEKINEQSELHYFEQNAKSLFMKRGKKDKYRKVVHGYQTRVLKTAMQCLNLFVNG